MEVDPHRARLGAEGKLSYALMDFDVSLYLPSSRPGTVRRPYTESFLGRGPHPYDTDQGELDYDPFAFDVGTLGVSFCERFQVCMPTACPFIAQTDYGPRVFSI